MNTPVPPPPPPPKPDPPLRPKPPARANVAFNFALTRPREERDAFLAAECGDDAALKAEVRALLAAHEAAGDFLKTHVKGLSYKIQIVTTKRIFDNDILSKYGDALMEASGTEGS